MIRIAHIGRPAPAAAHQPSILEPRPTPIKEVIANLPGFAVAEPMSVRSFPKPLFATDLTLDNSFVPVKTLREFSADPYRQLSAVVQHSGPDDLLWLQVFFAPVPQDTVRLVLNFLETLSPYGDSMWCVEPAAGQERAKILRAKSPAWHVRIRMLASNEALLKKSLTAFFSQYETINTSFQASAIVKTTAIKAIKNSPTGFFLASTDELLSLAHFPSDRTAIENLETVSMKATLPPPLYTERGVTIGTSNARGQSQSVTLPHSVRDRHTYLVGKSGTGKSTVLFNAALQDIQRGTGICVIDPHGDLVKDLLDYIPEHRVKDVIYFDPQDTDYPLALNPLTASSPKERSLVVDDLMTTFKRLADSWGAQMEHILRYTFDTLLVYKQASFFDIKTILQDQGFRSRVVSAVSDDEDLVSFWQIDFKRLERETQPILNRMSKFARDYVLRGILSQARATVNFYDIIRTRKIFLANISKGEIGTETSKLLGSILVSQIQLAAMRQAGLPPEARVPCYLYVDEFHNFTSSAFETILSEARKYKLCLTLAHQYISQLPESTRKAILGNVGTIILFQLSTDDLAAIKGELGRYEAQDLPALEKYHALCRPLTSAKDTFSFKTEPPPPQPSRNFRDQIIAHTRQTYSRAQATSQAEPAQPIAPPSQTRPEAPAQPKARFCPYCGTALPAAALFCPGCSRPTSDITRAEAQPLAQPLPQQSAPAAPSANVTLLRPAPAIPKEFRTTQDRILYYLNLAEYLSTKQIIVLCYAHLSKTAQKAAASRDLKQFVEAKKVKAQFVGKEKIFFVGKSCSPTTHNLAIRELFTKIERSGFEIAKVDFCQRLGGLTPDLAIDFVLPDGQLLPTFWEYDAGTEGIAELESKIGRYARAGTGARARVFVYDTPGRRVQAMRVLPQAACVHAVLGEFESLNDPAFHFAPGIIAPLFS